MLESTFDLHTSQNDAISQTLSLRCDAHICLICEHAPSKLNLQKLGSIFEETLQNHNKIERLKTMHFYLVPICIVMRGNGIQELTWKVLTNFSYNIYVQFMQNYLR